MVTGAAGNSQSAQQKTKQFNVTDLTLHQKRRLFVNCFAEGALLVLINGESATKRTMSSFIRPKCAVSVPIFN
jgi:hypothetical protein